MVTNLEVNDNDLCENYEREMKLKINRATNWPPNDCIITTQYV